MSKTNQCNNGTALSPRTLRRCTALLIWCCILTWTSVTIHSYSISEHWCLVTYYVAESQLNPCAVHNCSPVSAQRSFSDELMLHVIELGLVLRAVETLIYVIVMESREYNNDSFGVLTVAKRALAVRAYTAVDAQQADRLSAPNQNIRFSKLAIGPK